MLLNSGKVRLDLVPPACYTLHLATCCTTSALLRRRLLVERLPAKGGGGNAKNLSRILHENLDLIGS